MTIKFVDDLGYYIDDTDIPSMLLVKIHRLEKRLEILEKKEIEK